MGFEDQHDDNAGGNQGTIGLVITLAVIFSLVGVILIIIIIIRFCAKSSSQQRTRHNDLLYLVRIRIAPTNDMSSSDNNQSPNSGLDPEIIASLPKLLYKETDHFKQGEVIMECSVCLGTIVEDAEIRVIPNCKHIFHVDCVDTWLSSNRTCPVCRTVAEPRVVEAVGNDNLATDQDGVGMSRVEANHELEKVEIMGCSGLRTASFPRMIISMGRRSLRRNKSYDGSAAVIQDVENQ